VSDVQVALLALSFVAGFLFATIVWLVSLFGQPRSRGKIVGQWRLCIMNGNEFLLLSGVAAKRANGAVEPLETSEFQLTVAGPGEDVPIPEGVPADTQAAVLITGEEGTIETVVTSSLYPDAEPLYYSVAIANPVTEIVGNWTRWAAPPA
jgi:hypothetical protein